MAPINRIQQELKAIDPASFQRLGNLYLRYQPRYENLKPLGSVIGADKVRKGSPDSIVMLSDGGYALIQYTTQQSGLAAKLTDDFEKCFDETLTHIPISEVREILLVHNSALDSKDELTLLNQGRERNCLVKVIGLEALSYDLYQKYPALARDELGIEVDTGQIVRPDEFVTQYNKNAFSTPLDTSFHFRENELQLTLDALNSSDLVFITGAPGVGKSRLMLEAAARFRNQHPSYAAWCIFNRGADLFEDLRSYFSPSGQYLVLVDDANRLDGRFDYVLQLLHDSTDTRRVKVITTVRDYARTKVLDAATRYGGGVEVQVPVFEDKQITALVSEEAGVKSSLYLDRITELAQGNPRLAMMAARIAVTANTLESISDVSALYDEYFRSMREDFEDIGDPTIIKTAAGVAFLRVLDRSNQAAMSFISQAFEIPPSALWPAVERLHQLEAVNLYEDDVARFADQVLATYLFYLAVFKLDVVDLGALLDHTFPQYSSQLVDALHPVVNALGADVTEQLRPHVEQKWDALSRANDEHGQLGLLQLFWFVIPTHTLLYIRSRIQRLSATLVDPLSLDFRNRAKLDRQSFLDLLACFRQPDQFLIALDLALDALAKQPTVMLRSVLDLLTTGFGIKLHSYLSDFYHQKNVVRRLQERSQGDHALLFARAFIAVASSYLKTHFEVTESKGSNAIVMTQFNVPPTAALRELRSSIWRHLFLLFSEPALRDEVLQLLHDYCHSGYQVTGAEICGWDAEHILHFLSTRLDPDDYQHLAVVQSYLGFLRKEGLEYDPSIEAHFTNELSALADLLLVDRHLRRGLTWQEAQAWQERSLREYLQDCSLSDYQRFFSQWMRIREAGRFAGSWDQYHSLETVLAILAEADAPLYVSVIKWHLDIGNPFEICDRRIIARLIDRRGLDATHDMIRQREFRCKTAWLFGLLAVVPTSQVDEGRLVQLMELYRSAPLNEIHLRADLFERYLSFDELLVPKVIELLLGRIGDETDEAVHLTSALLFFLEGSTPEQLRRFFGPEHMPLLKRIYLLGASARDYADHEGRVFNYILDLDPDFLCQYVDSIARTPDGGGKGWLNRYDSRDYRFLWKREDHAQVVGCIVRHLQRREQAGELYPNEYLANIFVLREHGQRLDTELSARRMRFLTALVEEEALNARLMTLIFEVVGALPDDERRDLIGLFLQHNRRVADFEQLPLFSLAGSWTGSAVPIYQAKLEFCESLFPMVHGIELLEQRFHIEKRIEAFRRAIEAEKRRDFGRDL